MPVWAELEPVQPQLVCDHYLVLGHTSPAMSSVTLKVCIWLLLLKLWEYHGRDFLPYDLSDGIVWHLTDHDYGGVSAVWTISLSIKGYRNLDIISGWRGAMGWSPLVTLWFLLVELSMKIMTLMGAGWTLYLCLNHPGTHRWQVEKEERTLKGWHLQKPLVAS